MFQQPPQSNSLPLIPTTPSVRPCIQDGATSLVVAIKEGEAGAESAEEEDDEVTARVLDKLMEIAIRYPMVRSIV